MKLTYVRPVFWGILSCIVLLGCDASTIDNNTNGKPKSAFTVFRAQNGLADDFVTDITVDYIRNGVWFATQNGISFYSNRDSLLYTFGAEYDIPDMEVTSIAIDYSGTVWAGTISGAASMAIGDTMWTSLAERDKLISRYITALAPMSDFSLWFGTKGGVSIMSSQGWKSYSTQLGPSADVTSIYGNTGGLIWVGTTNGIGVFDGKNWISYGQKELLSSTYVNVIFIDLSGIVWIGTTDLAVSYNNGVWSRFGQADGLTTSGINDFAQDSAGMIWTATNGGVFYYSNNKWAMLSLPSEITGAVVTALAVDKKNNILWIGTTSGAVRYSTGTKK